MDSLPFYPFGLRWRIHTLRSRLFGRSGYFAKPEQSNRARLVDEIWDTQFRESPPFGSAIRYARPDRWVRFWSLPEGKRYADTPDEYEEIYRRHEVALDHLRGGAGTGPLVVIAEDWNWHDLHGGWTKRHLPAAWPWRIVRTEEGASAYFWVAEVESITDLKPLLLAVAEDDGAVTITDHSGAWFYHPYDGGGDLIARSPAERDELAALHRDWLSDNELGL